MKPFLIRFFKQQKHSSCNGVGLVVLAVICVTISAITIMMFNQDRYSYYEKDVFSDDYERLTYVKAYFLSDTRNFKCPANPTLKEGDANYLKSEGTYPACISANLNTDATKRYFKGAVPVRSMGISDKYAFDNYGNKITYLLAGTADNLISGTKKFFIKVTDHTCMNTGSLCGDTSKYTPETHAQAPNIALISHGKNGVGAYNKLGWQIPAITLPNNKKYDNIPQAINHDMYVSGGVIDKIIYVPVIPIGNPSNTSSTPSNIDYDDIVVAARKNAFIPNPPNTVLATYGLLLCALGDGGTLKLSVLLTLSGSCEAGSNIEWDLNGTKSTNSLFVIIPILPGTYNVAATCRNSDNMVSEPKTFSFKAALLGLGGGLGCN